MRHENETVSLPLFVSETIEDRLYDLNTMMPGTIQEIDKIRNLVSVKPSFMRVYDGDEEPREYPVIPGVPLFELRSDTAIIRMPVKKGGRCMILFSQRALEKWKKDGTLARPGSSRLHHISDAVCIPGLYPTSQSKSIPDDLTIEFGKASLSIKDSDSIIIKIINAVLQVNKDGKFKFTNGTSNILVLLKELMEQEEAVLDAITLMTFPTSLGPTGTVINPLPFKQALQLIGDIRKKLTQMILE